MITCSNWKPTFEATPLPNGRPEPFVKIPLDRHSFRGCDVFPDLDAGMPVVRLGIAGSGGAWLDVAIAREMAGPRLPFPPSARVFWLEPAGGFPKGARLTVLLQVHENTPDGPKAWLRYEMPGGVPKIDRSLLGPVQVSGSANYVPDQQLLNGQQRSVIHGFLRIVLPSLIRNPNADQVYLRSDNLASTRNLDESAGSRLALGFEHRRPSTHLDLSPSDLGEVWVRTNQASTDQATGIALGRRYLGSDWNGPVWNGVFYSAMTPRLEVYPAQFQYLFRRDLRLVPGFTQQFFFDPSAELILAPLFIGLQRGQTATLEGNANLSFDIKGWYVTGLGPEYRYSVRLQLPVRIWVLTNVGISFYSGADENYYFRYSTGVGFDFSFRSGRLF